MLEHLHIRNLALIEDMALEFGEGLNVLTGETGAGKSFILKALGFLLGEKLSVDIVRSGADRAVVEGIFRLENEDLVLRRELMASSGRSRFYINDDLATQEAMRELRQKLVSHASQHAQQQLLQPAFQSAFMEKEITDKALLEKKDLLLKRITEVNEQISSIHAKEAALLEKRELLEMQKVEIEKVSPREGEEEELEEIRAQVKANVALKQTYNHAISLLHGDDGPGLIQMLQEFEKLLGQMATSDEGLIEERRNVEAFRQNLAHLGNSLPKPHSPGTNYDMDAIEERLFKFAQLKRKLKRSMPEILKLKDTIQENLSFLDMCALDLARLTKELAQVGAELREVLTALRPKRHEAADKMARRLETGLRELGFSEHVRVMPEYEKYKLWQDIEDERVRIHWAPNPGQKPQALDKIASGGELSRFLLALHTLDSKADDITYIFDEVDAGVGGITLNKLADKLEALADKNQIILITHWPQLAARGKRHFTITKMVKEGNTYTQCMPLGEKERKLELARMAGGGKNGEALAASLLENKEK